MSEEKEISLGTLIDGTVEQLKEYLADKDLGYTMSLNNTLKATFHMLDRAKNDLVKLAEDKEKCDNLDEVLETIKGAYVKLGKIELLVLILEEEIKNRTIDRPNSL